jgi:hypothetical protein
MDTLQTLKEYCKGYEYNRKLHGDSTKVEVREFIAPSGYHAPKIMEYRQYPPYTIEPPNRPQSLFVEIWIDNLCIVREEYHFKIEEHPTEQNIQEIKETMARKILTQTFMAGLAFNKQTIEKYRLDRGM